MEITSQIAQDEPNFTTPTSHRAQRRTYGITNADAAYSTPCALDRTAMTTLSKAQSSICSQFMTRASDGKAIRLHKDSHSALTSPNSKAISEQRCKIAQFLCRTRSTNCHAKRCSNDRPAVGSAYLRYLIDWPNGNFQFEWFPSCTWQPIRNQFR